MLHYNKIDVSEGIDVIQTSASKECIICHYRYFLDKEFKFQSSVCNGCRDAFIRVINVTNIAVLNTFGVDFRCIIAGNSKSEAVNIFKKSDISEKSE